MPLANFSERVLPHLFDHHLAVAQNTPCLSMIGAI